MQNRWNYFAVMNISPIFATYRCCTVDMKWHRMKQRWFSLNSCELTASITALANAIACKMTDDELTLLGVTLTQLGDTILTIATQRSICKPKWNKEFKEAWFTRFHICCLWVMLYEKIHLENLCILDSIDGSGWCSFWLVNQGCHKKLYWYHRTTAIIPTSHSLSYHLGNSVCAYGYWNCSRLFGSCIRRTIPQPSAVLPSTAVQLFLEHHFLQFSGIRLCIYLVGNSVDPNLTDDSVFPQGR